MGETGTLVIRIALVLPPSITGRGPLGRPVTALRRWGVTLDEAKKIAASVKDANREIQFADVTWQAEPEYL